MELGSEQLAQELAVVSAQLAFEQDRQVALQPYLVPKVERGIVGNSRYAMRLRQQIKGSAENRRSTLMFGEPGLEKDNIAALIHFSSAQRRQPLIKLNCATLPANGSELFGRAGGKPGLIEWVGQGSIILNNVQELPVELLPKIEHLLATGTYTPVSRHDEPLSEAVSDPRVCQAQILMISEKTMPSLEKRVSHVIKVPPLRVRKADIKAQVEYYLSLYCRSRRLPKPQISPEALRRLQSYDFPGNIRELQSLVVRAVVQSGGGSVLTEEIFWATATKPKQFRLNLLNAYPWLRSWLRSPWWPDRINLWLVVPSFAVVVGLLFWGPQQRDSNIGLHLFWAWWWPVVMLAFPVLGRWWCAVCPFMVYGEITQKLSLWLFPRSLGKWPRQTMERWGGWFLFGLFGLIFLWEELWDLQDTAYLSAWLLLLITAGAMVGSVLFERRLWCRYLCPIGGMNGLFAKLSMVELRAQQGTCSAECTTYQCYKGGPQKGEGQETGGCPLYSHPAQLQDNKDCVLCMTCLKACPHRSVELNLRPPGIELWTTHTPRVSELALLFLLLGGIYLHQLPTIRDGIQALWGVSLDLDVFWIHLGLSLVVLVVPVLVPLLSYGGIRLLPRQPCQPRSFLEMAYGFLPLVWGGTLAHYLHMGLEEGGRILPVAWATFGFLGESLPVVVTHPAVVTFLQGSVLILSLVLSVILTHKIARQPLRIFWPQHLGSGALAASLWLLIVRV